MNIPVRIFTRSFLKRSLSRNPLHRNLVPITLQYPIPVIHTPPIRPPSYTPDLHSKVGQHAYLTPIRLKKDPKGDNLQKIMVFNAQSCRNKANNVHDLIVEGDFDIVFLSETWLHKKGDEPIIAALKPTGYEFENISRGAPGGGLAVLYRENLIKSVSIPKQSQVYKSFELNVTHLSSALDGRRVTFLSVYRPTPKKKNKLTIPMFFEDFHDLLEKNCVTDETLLIVGDLNFHFDVDTNSNTRKIKELLDTFGLSQLVIGPTQRSGHTLDVIITNSPNDILDLTVEDKCVGDHHQISFFLPLSRPKKTPRLIETRKMRSINLNEFKSDLSAALSHCEPNIDNYDNTLREVLDKHAPSVSRRVTARVSAPWMSEEILEARKQRRQAERRWRASRLTVHKQIYVQQRQSVSSLIDKAKRNFVAEQVVSCKSSKALFDITTQLMGTESDSTLPADIPHGSLPGRFMSYFDEKINTIRESIDSSEVSRQPIADTELSNTTSQFIVFQPVTCQQVRKILKGMPSKSCDLDPVPTNLLKDCLDEVTETVTNIINTSLDSGIVPKSFKHAIVRPLLKKPGLDPENLKNYRPVSNLPFLSKVLEKVVLQQLLDHLESNNLLEPFQSAYRKGHCTETALLRVVNDLLEAADKGHVAILSLLDLSAAFDTLDHSIMNRRLRECGCGGTVLSWLNSYLKDRTQQVIINKTTSEKKTLLYGVPQGSVLGPVLFTIYTSPLGKLLKQSSSNHHFFADDTQLQKSALPDEVSGLLDEAADTIGRVSDWMATNKLKMNDDKTELLHVGTLQKLEYTSELFQNGLRVADTNLKFSNSVKNLGVWLDSGLSMDVQVNKLCQTLFFHLRRISKIRHLLSVQCANKLCVSFILSRIDYCNSLLYGANDKYLSKLQRIQNCAARLVLRRSRQCSAQELLRTLHWLPVRARIEYKIATICFKCLSPDQISPQYLSEILKPYIPSRTLRSQNSLLLSTPRFKLKTFGGKSFTVSGPSVWNSLPFSLRQIQSFPSFKKYLKTHLFNKHLS